MATTNASLSSPSRCDSAGFPTFTLADSTEQHSYATPIMSFDSITGTPSSLFLTDGSSLGQFSRRSSLRMSTVLQRDAAVSRVTLLSFRCDPFRRILSIKRSARGSRQKTTWLIKSQQIDPQPQIPTQGTRTMWVPGRTGSSRVNICHPCWKDSRGPGTVRCARCAQR